MVSPLPQVGGVKLIVSLYPRWGVSSSWFLSIPGCYYCCFKTADSPPTPNNPFSPLHPSPVLVCVMGWERSYLHPSTTTTSHLEELLVPHKGVVRVAVGRRHAAKLFGVVPVALQLALVHLQLALHLKGVGHM